MDQLLYISTAVPKTEVDRLRQKQREHASNAILPISVFHGNLIAGLSRVYDEICALSSVPIDRKSYNIFRYSAKKEKTGNVAHIIPGFFNLPVIKQLTVILKLRREILRWYRKNKAHRCSILIDGTFYTGLIALWLTPKRIKAEVGAIIVDYYSFMDPKGTSRSQRLYYKLLKRIDRFIFVTEHLAQLVNRDQKEYMIMEGLVEMQEEEKQPAKPGDCCIYAGGLHAIYGVKTLVDAFHHSELPYSLHLYGNGDLIDYINEMSTKDARIQYCGVVAHDRLLEIERTAKLLINPRPVYGELDTRFNFPSKLMEYMQSGRPVITTKLLGIPEDYKEYMYFFEDDTEEKIRREIEMVLGQSEEALSAFGERAKNYVNENKNSVVVAQKIHALMNTDKGASNEKID